MNFYIVMQGRTYIEEKTQRVIWTQILDKSGETPHSWERMQEVKAGDILFHYVKGELVSVSTAQSDCYQSKNPYDKASETIGFTVDIAYEELEYPLNVKDHFNVIKPLLPFKYSAFQENGDGNQGYLYPCNEMLAIKLLEMISDVNVFLEDHEQLEFAIGLITQKERDTLTPVLMKAEAAARAEIRKGERKFYQSVAPLWEHKCALCGIELPQLLSASHSKPWKDSTEIERLDVYNGLLLCKNHSALYEQGYIAFDGTGKIHISDEIPTMDYGKYAIHQKMRVHRTEENKKYFKWHKRNVFRGREKELTIEK